LSRDLETNPVAEGVLSMISTPSFSPTHPVRSMLSTRVQNNGSFNLSSSLSQREEVLCQILAKILRRIHAEGKGATNG
jgi:hypothetical protein